MSITFFVPGEPASQGSKVAVAKGVLRESSKKTGPWRERVALAASQAVLVQDMLPMEGPLRLSAIFYFQRPGSHYGSKKGVRYLKPNATALKTSTPDLSKMIRAIEDSMTKIVYHDDRQIQRYGDVQKLYSDDGRAGVQITVERAV